MHGNKGKKQSQDHKDKIGKANTILMVKKWKDKNYRNHMSEIHKGKKGFWKGKKNPHITGENNPRWIKDRTQLKKSENKINDSAYIVWRKEIRKRDKNICRLLSTECKGRLETHHIFDWINYPQLRYITTNGITLCAFHHPYGREEEKRMIPILQELLSVSNDD